MIGRNQCRMCTNKRSNRINSWIAPFEHSETSIFAIGEASEAQLQNKVEETIYSNNSVSHQSKFDSSSSRESIGIASRIQSKFS